MATKKIKVPVVVTTEVPESTWTKIKKFFYRSESVFLAWFTGIMGTLTAAVSGVLASTNFDSVATMLQSGLSFRKEQLIWVGGGALFMGAIQYWTRVRGTKEVDGKLLPKAD